jgi:hypothetical protein
VSIAEWVEFIEALVRLALALAGDHGARWSELVGRLGPLSPSDRTKLFDELDRLADSHPMDRESRLLLWEKLHTEVARHRRFSKAEWAMEGNALTRMQAVADRIEPITDIERFAYLFEWRPDLPHIDDDHARYDAELQRLRLEAVIKTIETAGVEGLRALATRSRAPSQLGWTVGGLNGETWTPAMLTWLDSEEPKVLEVARAWAQRRLQLLGVPWLCDALASPETQTEARRTQLVTSAPPTAKVWDALQSDPALNDAYWTGMNWWGVSSEDAERAVQELLSHDRPWVAIDLLSMQIHSNDSDDVAVSPALMEEAVGAAASADPSEARVQSLGYEIGLILDHIGKHGASEEDVAKYEFIFFNLLEDSRRQPRALFRTLARDAALFVDLVQRVYRGKNEPKRELNELDEALARHSLWVLAHWATSFPGQLPDGSIDAEQLKRWVCDARDAFAESDRADIGDEQIGQVLARSPVGQDGIWPAEAVRDLVEGVGSQGIETGVHVGIYHGRGVTTRGLYDGGAQERALAAKYSDWAHRTAGKWRRTNRLLRDLAESYERDARREDDRANVSADTG